MKIIDVGTAYPIAASEVELQAAAHLGLVLGLCNGDGSTARMKGRLVYSPPGC